MPSGIRKYLHRQGRSLEGTGEAGAGTVPVPVLEADRPERSGFPARKPETVINVEAVRNLAHELRSPLTAIKSSLQLVTAGEAGPLTADQEHFLSLALRNLDRLDRMTTDLLDKERGRTRRSALAAALVDLGPVLRDAARLHGIAANKEGLDFDAEGLPESFPAEVDTDGILQVVDNLLSNARKFTRPAGLVRIWLEQHPALPAGLAKDLAEFFLMPLEVFTLVVEDSGRGIAPERQARLFEAFSRVHDQEGMDIPGSGLGLHITRDLVGAMGGTLSLASRQGQGTTVWVRLPRNEKTRRLLLAVARFQARAAAWNRVRRSVQIAGLDLRDRAGGPDRRAVRRFLAQMEEQNAGVGDQVAPGLWVAAMDEPGNWSRAWSRFTFRDRTGTPETSWRRLGTRRVLTEPEVAQLI